VLVLVTPHQREAGVTLRVTAGGSSSGVRARKTTVVVTADAVPKLTAPAALVADRWGEILYPETASGDQMFRFPDVNELLSWVHFIETQCPGMPTLSGQAADGRYCPDRSRNRVPPSHRRRAPTNLDSCKAALAVSSQDRQRRQTDRGDRKRPRPTQERERKARRSVGCLRGRRQTCARPSGGTRSRCSRARARSP
jgi:hypothetical protein